MNIFGFNSEVISKAGTILCSQEREDIGIVPSEADRNEFVRVSVENFKAADGNEGKEAYGFFAGWESATRDKKEDSGLTFALGYVNIVVKG